ncbi:sodium:solute symporter family transporter [Mucisphaera sp.]|uniref:sodium:solute symporter family transporter n=1 Tax=Mucisphaera sp. TaxID=2913024 RepID=UPI003D13CDFD
MFQALTIEHVIIGVYLLMLVAIGFVLQRLNSDSSDYFRSGCRAKWWMVGASAFMTAFSAFTFTGAAGAAYVAGLSITVIFLTNVAGFLIQAAFLAGWFRQLRAVTFPEVLLKRFGALTQQFYALITVPIQLCYAAVWLWGLGTFVSGVFRYDIDTVILVTGSVVLLYSLIGGSWAVLATDFLQTLILIPITILIAVLCLNEVGGVSGLIQGIQDAGLASDYAMVNDPNRFPLAEYAWPWVIATIIYKLINHSALESSQKYFAVKDGREARKAALLAAVLSLIGVFIWFIPPMTARIIMADEVAALPIDNAREGSYGVISMALLPAGLTGVMVVAMFSATMSSMDSGLNRNAAIFTRDIYPFCCKLLNMKPVEGQSMLRLGQAFSLGFGLAIIGLAYYFANSGGRGIFQTMLDIGGLLALPMFIPMLLAIFFKYVPWWSAIFAICCAFVPSLIAFLAGSQPDKIAWLGAYLPANLQWMTSEWSYAQKIFTNTSVGCVAFFLTMPFWRFATAEYKQRVEDFYKQMHTPVRFSEEVGEANDDLQRRVLGTFASIMGSFICSLILIPNDLGGRLGILFVGGFVLGAGLLLLWSSRRAPATDTPPTVAKAETT